MATQVLQLATSQPRRESTLSSCRQRFCQKSLSQWLLHAAVAAAGAVAVAGGGGGAAAAPVVLGAIVSGINLVVSFVGTSPFPLQDPSLRDRPWCSWPGAQGWLSL